MSYFDKKHTGCNVKIGSHNIETEGIKIGMGSYFCGTLYDFFLVKRCHLSSPSSAGKQKNIH